MTAISIIRQRDQIHVLSDGAFYKPDGTLTNIAPKVFPLPHMSAAIAFRGSQRFIKPFYTRMMDCNFNLDNLDHLLLVAAMWGREAFDEQEQADYDNHADLFLAGYSDARARFESYVMPTHDRYSETPGFELCRAFELFDLPEVAVTPQPTAREYSAVAWIEPPSTEAFDPVRDGTKLMEAQRLCAGNLDSRVPDGLQGYGVGGFIMLTTITRYSIHQSILRRWPDEIGRPIEPSRDKT